MPVTQFGTRAESLWTDQDVDQFVKYQVWYAEQQAKKIAFWSRWQKKYGTLKWERNMGPLLNGVIAEPSAVSTQKHVPKNITEAPKVTEVRHFERTTSGRIKRHLWQSPMFHFLSSFQDFRKKQLAFASNDLTKQIGVGNDQFVRWQALQQCKYVYVVGASSPLIAAPFGEATDTSEPKDANFFVNMAAKLGSDQAGFLTFRNIAAAVNDLKNALGAYPWEGLPGEPKENETVKGTYLLTGDESIYSALAFDEHVLATKADKVDFINSEFSGRIGSNVTFLAERYPLRYVAADGSFPAPEIEELDPNNAGKYETIPNPPYAGIASDADDNANIGIAFLEGYQPFETLEVGPPPSEFASGTMSMKKFASLNWNGEVRMTDDLIVNYGSNKLDTNKWGEWLQLIADTTMGIIPNTPRHLMAIIYRINRKPSLTTAL